MFSRSGEAGAVTGGEGDQCAFFAGFFTGCAARFGSDAGIVGVCVMFEGSVVAKTSPLVCALSGQWYS
jgi:hypothetical protein